MHMSATTANSATPTSTTTANTTTMALTTNTPTTPNTTTTTTGAAYTTTYPTSTTRTTTTCISNIIARGVLLLPRPMPSCQAHHHTDSRPRTGERLRFETAPKARHYLEKFLAGDARVPPLECLRPPQQSPVACDRLSTDATMDTEEVLGMRTTKKTNNGQMCRQGPRFGKIPKTTTTICERRPHTHTQCTYLAHKAHAQQVPTRRTRRPLQTACTPVNCPIFARCVPANMSLRSVFSLFTAHSPIGIHGHSSLPVPRSSSKAENRHSNLVAQHS